jgi:hypothetical protein
MWELLAVGTFWFWAFLGLAFLVLTVLVNMESLVAAAVTIGVSMALLQVFGAPVFSYIVANPQAILLWACMYLGLGVLYSVAKWWLYVTDQRWKYDDAKAAFLESNNLPSDTRIVGNPELVKKWTAYVSRRADVHPKVSASENKARICGWICYWPWSGLWTMINQPIKRIATVAYRAISKGMQRISDHAFRGTEGETE